MKFFIAFAALVALAIATPLKPTANEEAQLEAIIAAIQSPSTDPATAALLEQQLQEIMGLHPIHVGPAIVQPSPEPIHVGPAIVQPSPEPIHVGPAIVQPSPEPIHVGPAIVQPSPEPIHVGPAIVQPSPEPIPVGPAPNPFPIDVPEQPSVVPSPPASPLVQIIVNVNQASDVSPVSVSNPVQDIVPSPVHIVDNAQEEIAPTPVQVEEIAPSPVNIVEEADAPAEPIIIANPIVPVPVVTLPETLN